MHTAAAGSETGRRYRANFDVAHLSTEPLLAVVADGMGDGPGSAMASRTAVDLVVSHVTASGVAGLRPALAEAHRTVSDFGRSSGTLAGCTLTALVEALDGLWLAQLGDSRAYRLRSGLLELLTVDHTMAWLGAVHGWWPHDSPQAHAARYQLTRYVGHPSHPDPDLLHLRPQSGDVYLLCTDGVAEQVPYHRILDVLRTSTPEQAVAALLADSEAAGGNDNATAVVVRT
ncbi:PP2C family protein-serine/threonine phosphatase [Saccharothrix variisporea]|uniref:Serine/threonine protein phosphatase PrpC n=1 Tax=Saccharothrix variisporea TaxID=543527 RepID=A0A495XF14_9PSEU|nr:protein phosphatase 2C domain-containing protein [Saccharothrix variisporea]RKT73041.1 serine/threonine protein phosphatase PrpC [Saccharothrix variisporea]